MRDINKVMLPSFSKKARIYLKYIQNLARKRIYSNNAHNSLATLHISSYAHIYIYKNTEICSGYV